MLHLSNPKTCPVLKQGLADAQSDARDSLTLYDQADRASKAVVDIDRGAPHNVVVYPCRIRSCAAIYSRCSQESRQVFISNSCLSTKPCLYRLELPRKNATINLTHQILSLEYRRGLPPKQPDHPQMGLSRS